MELALTTAAEAARAIRDGLFTSEELVSACLERIEKFEEQVNAWAFLKPDYALELARQADMAQQAGVALGPLHGVPVGLKDIIDTCDMPTENGTILHRGRQPRQDATIVSRLRAAGAVIIGKTVTTELAVYSPGKTSNPHNPEHTPGGSSSGSAAAVAAGMVPLAVGTQTNGSVIRPASFCGVYGYKPTYGLISRNLVLQQSPPLDQIGVFARTIEDAALLVEVLSGYDPGDPATRPQPPPALVSMAAEEPPVTPRLAFVKTPVWDQAEGATQAGFAELVEALGEAAHEVVLPEMFAGAHAQHQTIMEADLAGSFAREYQDGKEKLSAVLTEMIERGRSTLAVEYNSAVAGIEPLYRGFDKLFEWHDAIITPAVIGEAPHGLTTTGSPVFCTIWTLCGMPSITLPLLQGEKGLPLGVQLVGPRGDDARLLRTARWLVQKMAA